jgi:hypothetical protein
MAELSQRSWEYQIEFAVEMTKQCKAMMGDNKSMHEALDVFEYWYFPSKSFVLMEGWRNILIHIIVGSRSFEIQCSFQIYILVRNVS